MRALGYLSLPLRVDALVVEHQEQQRYDTRYDEPKFKSMTEKITRRVFCAIEVGGHG